MSFIQGIKTGILQRFANAPSLPLPEPGMYHYVHQQGKNKARIHLRLEQDGHGLLLVNANRVFHLNPTAAFMAYLSLEGISPEGCVLSVMRAYNVPQKQAEKDYEAFERQLQELTLPEGPCPVCDLELETLAPFSMRPSAPYRMDLALTYRCNNDCSHCYNARPRQQKELDTTQWKDILDQLWQIGIPHIVFTGGEPTLRRDLPELIAHAEKNGQITGINTNGRRLKDSGLVNELVSAGLDHVQITLESHDAAIHDRMVRSQGAWQETICGIRNVVDSPLFIMTNSTLLQENAQPAQLIKLLDFLAELRVPTVGLNALIYSGHGLETQSGLPESALPPLLDIARNKTSEHEQRLIWYTPTQYCHFDPIQLGLGVKGCTAALYNMCIEPEGSVIPCQSYYQSLGNMLTTPWEKIWNHDLAVSLRERKNIPEACQICDLLPECGGGCPLAQQAGRTAPPQTVIPLQY